MSAWLQLEKSLRRVKRLRELSAPQKIIDDAITIANGFWARVPLTPAGMTLEWPPDIQPLARELGFDPDTRGAGPRDAALEQGVARATRMRDDAIRIQRAIEAAGGVSDLVVLVAGPIVTLKGFADDEAAFHRAAEIAKQQAPDILGVDNKLVVRMK